MAGIMASIVPDGLLNPLRTKNYGFQHLKSQFNFKRLPLLLVTG